MRVKLINGRFAKVALIALVALAVSTLGVAVYGQLKSHESSDLADVSWRSGDIPMTVVVTVNGHDGRPVSGVDVMVDNDSGGESGQTNKNGVASLKMGELEFTGLEINGIRVVDRQHAWILGPGVSKGLTVTVQLKRPLPPK